MKLSFDPKTFRWEGIEARAYKDQEPEDQEPAHPRFQGIVRYPLSDQLSGAFELRYFELEPGGYSNLEKHRHAHFVIALRGTGRALVGEAVLDLEPFDAVYVPPLTPHRWINEGEEPFGFLCPVDADRDRPQPLDEAEQRALRSDPATARYAF